MTQGFQGTVNTQPAPAVAGDWAGGNPRSHYLAGAGGLVTGPNGLTIARFAWASQSSLDSDNAPAQANNFGAGVPSGLVHRAQQGLNTTFLSNAAMTMPGGFPCELCIGGDLWVKNDGASEATWQMKAYANLTTGQVSFAVTGSPTTAGVLTASVAASTFSVTGSIGGTNGNVMTVSAVGSGTVVNGATISGTNVATGTMVVSQITPLLAGESLGGVGRYVVNIPEQNVASTTISGTYGTLTATAVVSGAFVLNGLLSGTGVAAGTVLTQFLTGAGGNGTYVVNNNTVVTSTNITETLTVETKWIAMSAGAPGELVKISTYPLG